MKTNKQQGGMLSSTFYVEESMLLCKRKFACFFSGVAVEETCHPLKDYVGLQIENDIIYRNGQFTPALIRGCELAERL
jgi:hypothetical protein